MHKVERCEWVGGTGILVTHKKFVFFLRGWHADDDTIRVWSQFSVGITPMEEISIVIRIDSVPTSGDYDNQ